MGHGLAPVSPVRYELGFITQMTAIFIVSAVKTSKLKLRPLICHFAMGWRAKIQ
jgi:hypothetical protein